MYLYQEAALKGSFPPQRRWKRYFDQAIQETDRTLRLGAITLAIEACLLDFAAIPLETDGGLEKQRIMTAMQDLKVLRAAILSVPT